MQYITYDMIYSMWLSNVQFELANGFEITYTNPVRFHMRKYTEKCDVLNLTNSKRAIELIGNVQNVFLVDAGMNILTIVKNSGTIKHTN